MAYILIADSGSTKTDWCLIGDDGAERRVKTQGINPFHQQGGEIERIVREELLPHIDGATVASVYFYGSGCRKELCPTVEGVLRRAMPQAATVEVASDMLGAARALCGRGEGIACILGTGANSCLYDGERIVANTPSLGYILGDEGSGAVLGRMFINALYKGLLPQSVKEELEEETRLTLAGILDSVYRKPLPNRFLASLSPFIHRHLDVDGVRGIVEGNFRNFLVCNVEPYRRGDLPVAFVGSIASHYKSELEQAVAREGMVMGAVLGSPMQGLVRFHAAAIDL